MIGAIIGDIVGSPYEGGYNRSAKSRTFPLFIKESRFTDDSVLTCATADALLSPSFLSFKLRFARHYRQWALWYPDRGYGSKFKEWIKNDKMSVMNSYGDGCMMRCSPIAMFYNDRETALKRALQSIAYTHDSPESARGVQSIVDAIRMARKGATKTEIQVRVEEHYGHMLNLCLDEWKMKASRNIRCNLIAPQALTCFMASDNYESAVRNAVYTGGDTDTVASIAGSLAEAFYGVHTIPYVIMIEAWARLRPEMIDLINAFYEKCGPDRYGYTFRL